MASRKQKDGFRTYMNFVEKRMAAGRTFEQAVSDWNAHKKSKAPKAAKKGGKRGGKKGAKKGGRKPHHSHGKLLKKRPKWWRLYDSHLQGVARRRLKLGKRDAKLFARTVIFQGEEAIRALQIENFKASDAKKAIKEAQKAADEAHVEEYSPARGADEDTAVFED